MSKPHFDTGTLYDEGAKYFGLNGNSTMKFTAKGAKELCKEATARSLFIGCIEGGHWLGQGFRPDGNTRWDSKQDLEAAGKIKENNDLAAENIDDDASEGYNAFLITILK